MKYFGFPLFLFLISAVSISQAQETATPTASPAGPDSLSSTPTPLPGPVYQMEEVVVKAEKPKGDVWEGKNLDKLKSNGNLSSLLNDAGGMEAQGLGGDKGFNEVSIRGSSSKESIVIVDGQRMAEGFDLGLIPTDEIERIEVLKGPQALALGSDAMGGAVNITTRPHEAGAFLGASGGDFNTYQAQASTGGFKSGPWVGSLSGEWYQTGGYAVNTDEVSGQLSHQSEWSWGSDRLSLHAGYAYQNGGAPNGDSLSAQDTGQFDTDDREKKTAFQAVLEGTHPDGDWVFRPSLFYNLADINRLNPLGADNAAGIPPQNQNTFQDFGAQWGASAQWKGLLESLSLDLEERFQGVAGDEGLNGDYRWNNLGRLTSQGLLRFDPRLTLNLGGSLDWYETYGPGVFNPFGTLTYALEQGKEFFFSAGTAYRYPDFDELFHPTIPYIVGPYTPVEFGAGETGNPNLSPESSVNMELGTNLAWENFSLEVSGFADLYSNLIIPAQDSSNFWTFLNVAHAAQVGVEAGFHFNPWKQWALEADWTYLDTRDTDSGALIPTRLRQKLFGSLTWTPAPGLSIGLEGSYADRNPAVYNGPQDSPPLVVASTYTLWNADLSLETDPRTRFFINLDNLFNQTYSTFQGLPMPGRDLEVGMRVGL